MRLGDIASVKAGNVAPKKGLFSERGIPFVRAGSLSRLLDGESPISLERIDKTTADKLGMHLFPEGTILFAKSGMSCMTGNVYVLKEPCYVVSHLACVAIDNTELTLYLKHYFRWNKPNALVENPSFPSIRLGKIKDMEIRLPDARQIARWVSTLERIEGLMETHEHQLSLLDDLVKSRFVEMFGDPAASPKFETCRVEDIADVFVGVVVKPKQYYADDSKNAVKAFRSLNVGEMHIRDNDWVYFTQEGNQAASKSILKSGDILIVRSGYPGTSCIVSSEYEGCNAIDLIIARIKDDGVLPEFLAEFNNSTRMKDLIERMSVGSAQKHFNVGFYKQVEIPLPPIEIQREYLAFQHRVDKSRVVVHRQVVKYNGVIASSGIAIIGRGELV